MQHLCSKITLQTAAHSCTADKRDWLASCGIMWPLFASLGSEGQLVLHLCVDIMLFPSGITTVNLFLVGIIFFYVGTYGDKMASGAWI